MGNNREKIKERLNRVFQRVFEDDGLQIFAAMTDKDLEEWDSFKHVTLVVAIEKEFGVQFSAAEGGEFNNVGEMIDLLAAQATK